MRKVKIDMFGSILILNENNRLHSFDGKPSRISRSGILSFHNDGMIFKTVLSDGRVAVWSNVEQKDG